MGGMRRRLSLLTLIAAAGAAPAVAQTVAITPPGNIPDIGNVTVGVSGPTDFRVATTGAVSVVPGGGGTRQSGGNAANTITLTCSGGNNNAKSPCNATNVIVRVTPTTTQTGRAQPVNDLQIAMGTAVLATGGAPTYNGQAVTFTIQPIGRGSSKTFRLGLDLPITGGFGASGSATSSYLIEAGFAPGFTAAATGFAVAATRNPTSIAKTSDLSFGAILPLNGQTSTVTIDATSGARSGTPGVLLRPGLPTTRATFNVSGEGGQMIAVSVPTSFTMTGPGTPITVNLVSTADPGLVVGGDAGGTITVGGSAGNSGTATLGIGGSFSVTGPMTPGAYSGTINVVFTWN